MLKLLHRRAGGDLFVDYGWGSLIFTDDGDMQEVSYHLHQADWHREDMEALGPLLERGDTAVDVGANIGFVSLMLASLVGPDGTVVALEPSKRTFAKLTRTIEKNGLAGVVRALNVGCGAEPGEARLRQVSGSSGNATMVGAAAGAGAEDVALVRLDDLEIGSRVALVKIDTEGFEAEALKGAGRLLREDRPTIFIELGGHYLDSTLEAIALLADAGYDVERLRGIDWESVGNGANFVVRPAA